MRKPIRKGRRLFTESPVNRKKREWSPFHSKLAALLLRNKKFELNNFSKILYLGGGHGTTVSHLSDIYPNSEIYVVEFGCSVSKIIILAEERNNIFPIMEDAAVPMKMKPIVESGEMDFLYQDIAQKNQDEILKKNFIFLKPGGSFIFMLKIRSIHQSKSKKEAATDMMRELREINDLILEGFTDLGNFQKYHFSFFGKKAEKSMVNAQK